MGTLAALEDALAAAAAVEPTPREDSTMEPVEATESAEAATALTVFAGANIEDVIQGLPLLLLEVQVGQLRRQQHRKATLMHLIYSIVHVWRNLKEYSRVEYIGST